MTEIPLDDWAALRGVPKRTAQKWAATKKIPAKKKTLSKEIVKTWFGYVIDASAPRPVKLK